MYILYQIYNLQIFSPNLWFALIDIYGTLRPAPAVYVFFSSAHRLLYGIDYIMGHNTNTNVNRRRITRYKKHAVRLKWKYVRNQLKDTQDILKYF